MRHKTGQLDSLANLKLEELEAMRLEQAEKLKDLQDAYWSKIENKSVGPAIRKKMGFATQNIRDGQSDRDSDDSQPDH